MKRLLPLMLCIPFSIFAQKQSNLFKTGIKIAPELNFMKLDGNDNSQQVGLGFMIGIDLIEYQFSKHWAVGLQTNYSLRNYLIEFEPMFIDNIGDPPTIKTIKETIQLSSVEIPLIIKYYFNPNQSRRIYLSGGGAINYLLNASYKEELFSKDGNVYELTTHHDTAQTSYSSRFSLGVEFSTKQNHIWYLESTLIINPMEMQFNPEQSSEVLYALGLVSGWVF